MAKQTIKQRVDEFMDKNSNRIYLTMADMDEIYNIGGAFDIIKYAFYLGYIRGKNAKKGGAVCAKNRTKNTPIG